jgi:uncharacterized protein
VSLSSAAEWRVGVDGGTVAARYDAGEGTSGAVFVCAHGAAGNMNDRNTLAAAKALRAIGLGVVRFNFPYAEKKSGRPDPMPRLKECVAAVVARARETLDPARLFIGGRSMGGRAASMLAADGFAADGLLLLAYPLHPAGRPDQLRDAHLPAITTPVLACSGTRDPLCRRDLMEAALQKVRTRWTMHWIEGADHSFHVLKSSGRTDAQVLDDIAAATQHWISDLGGRA